MTLLVWIAVALMVGDAMLIAGIGAPGLWIAVIAVGIALVVIDQTQRRRLGPQDPGPSGDRREVRPDVPSRRLFPRPAGRHCETEDA